MMGTRRMMTTRWRTALPSPQEGQGWRAVTTRMAGTSIRGWGIPMRRKFPKGKIGRGMRTAKAPMRSGIIVWRPVMRSTLRTSWRRRTARPWGGSRRGARSRQWQWRRGTTALTMGIRDSWRTETIRTRRRRRTMRRMKRMRTRMRTRMRVGTSEATATMVRRGRDLATTRSSPARRTSRRRWRPTCAHTPRSPLPPYPYLRPPNRSGIQRVWVRVRVPASARERLLRSAPLLRLARAKRPGLARRTGAIRQSFCLSVQSLCNTLRRMRTSLINCPLPRYLPYFPSSPYSLCFRYYRYCRYSRYYSHYSR
mmetsp:Transcript_27462/g.59152  ORF Transcript_27462/g.59152 Transcript_27462/m.59152 type:complete len:310 (-) Transcript_27462:843-1772(-)